MQAAVGIQAAAADQDMRPVGLDSLGLLQRTRVHHPEDREVQGDPASDGLE